MLQDRPGMQAILPDDHPLFQWVIARFNGVDFGWHIHWDAGEPESGFEAECQPQIDGLPPHIRVSHHSGMTPHDQWASVIFELNNIVGGHSFHGNWLLSFRLITPERYADIAVRREFRAIKKSRQLFARHPLPGATQQTSPWYYWLMRHRITFPEYRAACLDHNQPVNESNFAYFRNHARDWLNSNATEKRRVDHDISN